MLKHLSIFAALIGLATGSAGAQQKDPIWHKVEVPGADFILVFATTKNPVPANSALRAFPDPLVVYPAGSELAFAVDGEVEQLFKDVGTLRFPACAFSVERKGGKPFASVAYVLPKDETAVATEGK